MKKALFVVFILSFLFSCQKPELVQKYERIAELEKQIAEKDALIKSFQRNTDSSAVHIQDNLTVKKDAGKKPIRSSGATTTKTQDKKKTEKKPSVIPVNAQKQKKPDDKKDTKNTIEKPVKESSGKIPDQPKQTKIDDKTGKSKDYK
ncbi:hypothetical protein H9Q08_17495 [Chryseobacterium sp. PS-8]|uniref:Lipoprotein n=1 Tax=Chryseobacterium indicum TaxID=2766954 RepID=A0ABS9CBK6_9FLAO|nr:hypothetical protein [Chryseobacterium sp. PS-8]MCF2221084.1 hypothetical protein [Chryseobacterium sp. PS-8]